MADLKIFARTIEPEAMAQIEQMAAAPVAEGKVNFLIKVLKFIIAESGFELLARIEIKDKKTGRCFR